MASVSAVRARPLVVSLYVTLAAICVAIAFGGFLATYWLPVAAGTFAGSPLLHLHGLLFSAWTLLLLSQAWLMANRGARLHRGWGIGGVSLATAMVFVGTMVAVEAMVRKIDAGHAEAARAFLIVPMSGVLLFAGFVAAALVCLRRPEWHKRFMVVATVVLLNAPMARFFFLAAAGGAAGARPGIRPPIPVEFAILPAMLTCLILVAGIVHDWRRRGRPHPAWLIGLAVLVLVPFARVPASRTETWHTVADFLARFAG